MSNTIFRNIAAVLVGGMVAGALIMAIESINYVLYPPPDNLDFSDKQEMITYVESLPVAAFVVVLAAYAVGSFGGGWTAAKIARSHHMILVLALAGLFQLGAIYNFSVLPTPTWMWVAGFLVFFPPAYCGGRLGQCGPTESDGRKGAPESS